MPPREGLDAARVRVPATVHGAPLPWATVGDFLAERLPAVPVAEWLAAGRFVDETGRALAGDEPCEPATFVWFHKDLPAPGAEPDVPGELTVLYRDERLVVVDKPHFMATMPRGVHVRQTALVRLRVELDLPELAPAHRLDRLTAGVLMFTVEPRWRRPYQLLFDHRQVEKEYEAIAPALPEAREPLVVRSHIVKPRGSLRAVEVPGAPPNAETWLQMVEQHEGLGRYTLRPRTGRTHQLRVHLASLGAPIVGDPLYGEEHSRGHRVESCNRVEGPRNPARPAHTATGVPGPTGEPLQESYADPLRLVARSLAFTDPVDGGPRRFVSSVAHRLDG